MNPCLFVIFGILKPLTLSVDFLVSRSAGFFRLMNPCPFVILGILKPLTISVDILVSRTRLKVSFVLEELRFIVIWVTRVFVIILILYV